MDNLFRTAQAIEHVGLYKRTHSDAPDYSAFPIDTNAEETDHRPPFRLCTAPRAINSNPAIISAHYTASSVTSPNQKQRARRSRLLQNVSLLAWRCEALSAGYQWLHCGAEHAASSVRPGRRWRSSSPTGTNVTHNGWSAALAGKDSLCRLPAMGCGIQTTSVAAKAVVA